MDKFIVSARKYRPQRFDSVIGQEHITTTLRNAIRQQHLAHAFLFCGPRGVGKTTCARILAKTINCEQLTPEGEACNQCSSCRTFDQGTSMNIFELDAASNNGVDAMRELIEQVRFAPQGGTYKVYIIDEVHMLSTGAFNAFLKTLEEPPPFVIFILATTEKQKILPTILSRCQIFDFKRITTSDTVRHLASITREENIAAETPALHVIAQKSEGCLRDALSLLDKLVSFSDGKVTYSQTLEHLNILDEDQYFSMLDHLSRQQVAEALLLMDRILARGFEGDTFLEGLNEVIRNLLVSSDERSVTLLDVPDDFRDKYLETARALPLGWLICALNVITESLAGYRTARNKRLHTELCLIRLGFLNQAVQLASGDSSGAKKKLTEAFRAVGFRALPDPPAGEMRPPAQVPTPAPKLTVEVERKKTASAPPPPPPPPPASSKAKPTGSVKLGSLKKLHDRVTAEMNLHTQAEPLTPERLQEAWNSYIQQLADKKDHTTADAFRTCSLAIQDETHLYIRTDSIIQQRFIDGERSRLILHLQHFFKNPQILFRTVKVETAEENTPVKKVLSSKQHYQQLAESYPLIRALREKLNLDLD